MGLEAAILGPLIGGALSAGGNVLSTAMQPQPQRRVPFTGAVDPSVLLGQAQQGVAGLFNTLTQNMQRSTPLRTAYAQPVPGLTGVDPGYRDPSLRGIPGMDFSPAQALQQPPTPTTGPVRRSPSIGTAVPRNDTSPSRLTFGTPTANGSGANGLTPQQQASAQLLLSMRRAA